MPKAVFYLLRGTIALVGADVLSQGPLKRCPNPGVQPQRYKPETLEIEIMYAGSIQDLWGVMETKAETTILQ